MNLPRGPSILAGDAWTGQIACEADFLATALLSACGLLGAWVAVAGETRTTSLVSIGPDGGNGPFEAEYADTSEDGSRVFFETEDSLLAADSDEVTDVYERHGEALSLVSVGPQGGNAELGAYYFASFANGTRVLFGTDESLVSGDSDEAEDIYERSGGTTTLLSTGPEGGNGAANATYTASSADGSRIFFLTKEKLVSEDEDESRDLYERFAGTTTLLSTGPGGGNDAVDTSFVARSSADGQRVFFLTKEQLVEEDEDTAEDIYERFDGATTLISTGPEGGNAETGVFGLKISTDGTRVFFTTSESLVSADGDGGSDGYERSAGVTSLVTTGPSGNSGSRRQSPRGSPPTAPAPSSPPVPLWSPPTPISRPTPTYAPPGSRAWSRSARRAATAPTRRNRGGSPATESTSTSSPTSS